MLKLYILIWVSCDRLCCLKTGPFHLSYQDYMCRVTIISLIIFLLSSGCTDSSYIICDNSELWLLYFFFVSPTRRLLIFWVFFFIDYICFYIYLHYFLQFFKFFDFCFYSYNFLQVARCRFTYSYFPMFLSLLLRLLI